MNRYNIEGELLTMAEIRARVPARVRDSTLRARVQMYERRTWASLCEPPSHRPRPEQRKPRTNLRLRVGRDWCGVFDDDFLPTSALGA